MDMKWFENSLFVDVMDQYLIWRLNDLIEYDLDPKVRRACFTLKAYLEAPTEENDEQER